MHGQFVWYELLARDFAAARTFYKDVVGWGVEAADIPGMDYHMVKAGDQAIGGMMAMPEECGELNGGGWLAYIAVDDVDQMAEKCLKAGGRIHMKPEDIPGVGRFAIVADPEGAPFAIFRAHDPGMHQQAQPAKSGHAAWHELSVDNWERVFPFYAELFGWKKDEALNMGAMGVYQLFSSNGANPVGAMMNRKTTAEKPGWLFYFAVDDIDAAITRVKDAGGEVTSGPMEVPGGVWVFEGHDPQGGHFALVGPRKH